MRSAPDVLVPDLQLVFVLAIVDDHARKLHTGHGISCHVEVLRPFSRGSVGLNGTDPRQAPRIDPQFLSDERDLALLRQWAEIGKKHGMVQLIQLSHPGRQCPKGLNKETVAPSAVPFSPMLATTFGTPRELREDEILDIIQRFANAAKICEKAGFEGVQLHGAHGYLISQFLSPLTNKRQDKWGGSVENRMRFLLEAYTAVRAATSDNFIISVKLNSADFQRGGISEEDVVAVFKAIDAAGIDLIEVSGGTYEAPAMAGVKEDRRKASTIAREAYFLDFAAMIRQEVSCRLMVTGGFRTAAGMNWPAVSTLPSAVGSRSLNSRCTRLPSPASTG